MVPDLIFLVPSYVGTMVWYGMVWWYGTYLRDTLGGDCHSFDHLSLFHSFVTHFCSCNLLLLLLVGGIYNCYCYKYIY